MHIHGNSWGYGTSQAQGLLGSLFQAQSSSTGQTSPTGADSSASSTGSPFAVQGVGQQFATNTLASLLSLQEGPSQATTNFADSLVKQFDTDGDGSLSAGEIESALNLNGSDPSTASAVQSAIAKLDTNGDGELSAGELAAGLSQQLEQAGGQPSHGGHHGHHVSSGDLAANMIDVADANSDGELSLSEVSSALSSAGYDMSSSDLSAAFDKLDTNGDGELSVSELQSAVEALRKAHDGSGGVQTASTSTTNGSTGSSSTTSTSDATSGSASA